MPFYDYKCQNPNCEEVQEVRHGMTESPLVLCQNCKSKKPCVRTLHSNFAAKNGGKEIWDYNDVRGYKPKFLKSRDGKTRVRFDPSKHGYGKGTGG